MVMLGYPPARVSGALARSKGAEVSDDDLATLSRLAAEGGYAKLTALARDLVDAGVTDVRVIGFYLFGSFLEGGPRAVPELLEVLIEALTVRWTALLPPDKKPKLTDASLAWLFRTIVDRIDFQKRLGDATWARWVDGSDATVVARATELALQLRELVEPLVETPRSLRYVGELLARLDEHFNRQPAPNASNAPEEPDEPDEPDEPVDVEPAPPSEPAPEAPALPRVRVGEPPAAIEASPSVTAFRRKVALFRRLAERGDMPRAAIVANDLVGLVDHLDPRQYLPGLLAPYYRRVSEHAEELLPYLREPEGLAHALEQLYQADIDAFVASGDGEPAEAPRHARGGEDTLDVAPELGTFIRKLRAFDILVARGDMPRAAVVAEDVQRVVTSFDARRYLPGLLSPFYGALATHARDLAPYLAGGDSPVRRSLEQLYQVDLDAFEAA